MQGGRSNPAVELPSMEPSETPLLPMPKPIVKVPKGSHFAFMPDGDRLFVAASERAWMASLSTGELLFEFEKPKRFVSRVAVSDDGTLAAMAQSCGRVTFYDPQNGKKIYSQKVGSDTDVSGLAFAPGSHFLLHSDWHGVTVVDVDDNYIIRSLKASGAYPNNTQHYAIAFATSGDRFACLWGGHTTTEVSLFHWPSRNEIKSLSVESDKQSYRQSYVFGRLIFSPNGETLLLTAPDGSVILHSLVDSKLEKAGISLLAEATAIEAAPRFFLGDACFSPNGKLLAYRLNGILGVWEWPSGKCLGKWRAIGRNSAFCQIGFSQSGRELVACLASSPGGIFVYRTADLINSELG